MHGAELRAAPSARGIERQRVARAFRDRVLPCGVDNVNRLETAVAEKHARVHALVGLGLDEFADGFASVLDGIVAAHPHRATLAAATTRESVVALLEGAGAARLGPADLPRAADRLDGAPHDVRLDVAAELFHAAAPDRLGLLTRWVWNPARGTGILGEFGGPPPHDHASTQARLGELRLELDALGFPSTTFAAVDVLLALTYAGRLDEAVDRSFQGGGLERLLPGAYPLASMVLGVRRRLTDADR